MLQNRWYLNLRGQCPVDPARVQCQQKRRAVARVTLHGRLHHRALRRLSHIRAIRPPMDLLDQLPRARGLQRHRRRLQQLHRTSCLSISGR